MRIEFVEDITLALRARLEGPVTERRRFGRGEAHFVEFLGEDADAETIDFQFENGLMALRVGRFAIAITGQD